MYISNYIFILILNILNNINVILLFLIIIKKNYIYCVCVLIFNWLLLHHLSFPYHENMSSNSQFKQNCHVTGLRLGWWVEGLVKTLNPYLFFMVIYLQSKLQIWISPIGSQEFPCKKEALFIKWFTVQVLPQECWWWWWFTVFWCMKRPFIGPDFLSIKHAEK